MDETITIETANQCNCEQTVSMFEEKISSAFRKIYILISAMCFLCLMSLVACGSCIFLYTELMHVKKELSFQTGNTLNGGTNDGEMYYEYQTGYDYEDEQNSTVIDIQPDPNDREKRKDIEETPAVKPRANKSSNDKRRRNRQRKSNKSPRCCKRLGKKLNNLQKLVNKIERKVQNMTLQIRRPTTTTTTTTTSTPASLTATHASTPKQQALSRRQKFITHVAAAHYTSYVTNEYIASQFNVADPGQLHQTQLCKDMTEWHGKLCRNRTFVTSEAPLTLNVFKEAEWMQNISMNRVFDMRDGVFHARYTGLYLIYAHVLFYDSNTRQAVELVHDANTKDESTFRCTADVEIATPAPGFVPETRYIACSINAVVFMKKSETVRVRTLYEHSSIDLTPGSTYFGGLVFVSTDD